MKIAAVDPDLPARVRRTAREARTRIQDRIRRLKAAGMDQRAPVAECVTGGPDIVGRLMAIYDMTSGRIVYAHPGAIKSEPSEEGVMPTE